MIITPRSINFRVLLSPRGCFHPARRYKQYDNIVLCVSSAPHRDNNRQNEIQDGGSYIFMRVVIIPWVLFSSSGCYYRPEHQVFIVQCRFDHDEKSRHQAWGLFYTATGTFQKIHHCRDVENNAQCYHYWICQLSLHYFQNRF